MKEDIGPSRALSTTSLNQSWTGFHSGLTYHARLNNIRDFKIYDLVVKRGKIIVLHVRDAF